MFTLNKSHNQVTFSDCRPCHFLGVAHQLSGSIPDFIYVNNEEKQLVHLFSSATNVTSHRLLGMGSMGTIKGKGKFHPKTGHESPEREQIYISTLPSTSALDGVGDQRHFPAALAPGKTRYPLYRRLGGPQGPSGQVRKVSPPPGCYPCTVQLVACRYTD